MKKLALLLLFLPLIAFGQYIFFMGESSYDSTLAGDLESDRYGEDLTVFFAKNTESKFVVLTTQRILEHTFSSQVLIYLEDGDVVSSKKLYETDYVNRTVTGMFLLTEEQIETIKKSNIFSIQYGLNRYNTPPPDKFLSKNDGFDFPDSLKDF